MKQFSPHIYPEWGELISDLPIEKQAEIFNAILKYPNVDIDSGIWRFIKSQIDRDYEEFLERCKKNGIISRNYWKSKRNQAISNESERISNDNRTISNDILNINENINENININENDNKNELCREQINYETLFFEFWQNYIPVKCDGRFVDKGSKKLSFEKFTRILKSGVKYEDIIRGMQAYLNHCRENKQLTCTVPVFLNQQRWADDYNTSTIIADNAKGKRQETKSIVETYAEIAAEYAEKDNLY